MHKQFQTQFIPWRFNFVIAILGIAVLGLILRLVDLTIIKQHFLLRQGNARAVRIMDIPAFRGMVTDRHGAALAISTAIYSVWVNPQEFIIRDAALKSLSKLLAMKTRELKKIMLDTAKEDKEFVYLKRNLSPEIAEQIKKLKLPGIYLQRGYKRFYPEAEVTAHVLGHTNIDDQGQEGIELAKNDWLAGTPGKEVVIKDRIGRIISAVKTLQTQKAGNDLQLSIDKQIQYLAYRELLAGCEKCAAKSGSAVVMDAKTGEILAMVNVPSYNPNNLSKQDSDHFRNRAVTDVFEPGSVMKAFSVALALQGGRFNPNSIIDTNPGWIKVGKNIVRDEHSKGLMTVTKILQISSNVGVTKMILSLTDNQALWDLLHRAGFGEATGIGFPGERSGSLVKRAEWKPFPLATLSWGYGLTVTPLQLAEAFSCFANDGMRIPASIVPVEKPPQGIPVLTPKAANDMLSILESVVAMKGATGVAASVPGYRVAGKTGTSKINENGSYLAHRHISTFIGIAPVSKPKLIVVVVYNDPQGKEYYAGTIVAPVFAKIMEGALRILGVPPDAEVKMT